MGHPHTMRAAILTALVLTATLSPACLEYGANPTDDEPPGGVDSMAPGMDSEPWLEFVELCDGLDNDGDGVADEGFEDADGNGVKDCLECSTEQAAGGTVALRDSCGPDFESVDPWNVVLEWEVADLGGAFAPLLVADLDQDGVSEVVFQGGYGDLSHNVHALDGRTGRREWSWPSSWSYYAGLALVDLDRDRIPEVLAHQENGHYLLSRLENDGSHSWTATTDCGSEVCIPTPIDMDGDAIPELLSGRMIYDAGTGSVRADLGDLGGGEEDLATVGDIDLDGSQELVLAGCVWGGDLTRRWCRAREAAPNRCTAVLLQADDDPEAEILFLDDRIEIYEHDGTLLMDHTILSDTVYTSSPPSVADFDGDGQVELVFGLPLHLQMRELDGTLRWDVRLVDETMGLTTPVGFDFDADGASEVVVTDMDAVYILDGRTGVTRWTSTEHYSLTVLDHPVIADIDADGSAEIVVGSGVHNDLVDPENTETTSIRVFGHASNAWPSAGNHWPSYDFRVTNIDEQGTLNTTPPYSWQEWNMVRARPAAGGPRPNASLALVDSCAATCVDAGLVELSVQVSNDGWHPIAAGLDITLYAERDGTRVAIASTATTTDIPQGTSHASLILRAPVSETRGATLVLAVDGAEALDECVESDNELVVANPCP